VLTYSAKVTDRGNNKPIVSVDEIHSYRTYALFEALARVQTRADSLAWGTGHVTIFSTFIVYRFRFGSSATRADPRILLSSDLGHYFAPTLISTAPYFATAYFVINRHHKTTFATATPREPLGGLDVTLGPAHKQYTEILIDANMREMKLYAASSASSGCNVTSISCSLKAVLTGGASQMPFACLGVR
jgi:hypothetical protein